MADSQAREGEPAAKRQKLDVSAASVVYEPQELCDFIIESSDGKRLAVHRAFILRYSSFFGKLLEACPEDKVAVTETAEEIQSYFLDILYDRDKDLRPEHVLRVLDLADKYESPRLINACGSILCSEGFVLTLRKPGAAAGTLQSAHAPAPVHFDCEAGHCSLIDALGLASKYDFEDLFERCLGFIKRHAGGKLMLLLSTSLCKDKLGQLKPDHLVRLLQLLAGRQFEAQERVAKEKAALKEKEIGWELQRARLEKAAEGAKGRYTKLLTKYNKLISKARQKGVTP